MSSELVLNIIAIVVSFIALAASATIAVRQVTIMRQSNQLPLFVELFQEFRSERFQQARLYITRKMDGIDPAEGLTGLPDDILSAVNTVNNYFGALDSLIVHKILEEREAVTVVGYVADQLWDKLEPVILAERARRGSDDFACFFEDFIYRVRLHWPPVKSYGIVVHRVKDLSPRYNQPEGELPQNGFGESPPAKGALPS
jgi:hypothetical protein